MEYSDKIVLPVVEVPGVGLCVKLHFKTLDGKNLEVETLVSTYGFKTIIDRSLYERISDEPLKEIVGGFDGEAHYIGFFEEAYSGLIKDFKLDDTLYGDLPVVVVNISENYPVKLIVRTEVVGGYTTFGFDRENVFLGLPRVYR